MAPKLSTLPQPPCTSAAAARAVAYLRVSTKDQATRGGREEGFSLPAQREAIMHKAHELDAMIVKEFVEPGESGKTADRPALKALLAYIKENPVAYCLVHKVDRLARNRLDDAMIHYELRQAGVILVSATEAIDETPSGMLVHGIMSSIAEFYSLNLATEVTKGLVQKATAGGTPTKAPIGYLNVRRRDHEGREIRTVEIDPERAPLVQWAFRAYATGEWSVPMIHEELEARGLTSLPTPKRPAQPLALSSVHRMLSNPYYKGDIRYRGAIYNGTHTPLVPAEVWLRVQNVLAAHNSAGDRRRRHEHYLKGSLYCGICGSRMMICNARNKRGIIYPYFVCGGRHSKRTKCTMRAILVERAEQLVTAHYATIQLDPHTRHALEAMLTAEFDTLHAEALTERKELSAQREDVLNRRRASLQAHYAGAIPLDLLKEEQDQLARQLSMIDARLEILDDEYDTARGFLAECLALAGDCHTVYQMGSDTTRRMANQALFTKLFIDTDEHIRAEHNRPFTLLLNPDVQAEAREYADNEKLRTRTPDTNHDVKCSSTERGVELTGLEPVTPCLQSRCATNCAIAPLEKISSPRCPSRTSTGQRYRKDQREFVERRCQRPRRIRQPRNR